MGLRSWWKVANYRLSQSRRAVLVTILFVLAFAGGFALAFLASTPRVTSAGGSVLEEVAPAGTNSTRLDLPSVDVTDVVLEVGDCGLNLHFLRESEWRAFNASGTLPPPTLNCDLRSARLPIGVAYLVTENARGAPTNYRIQLTFHDIVTPFAILTIPGLVLVLVGSIGIIVQILRRGLIKTLDRIIKK